MATSPVGTLLRLCGPAILANTLSDDEVARAVAEHRAMRVYLDSSMGTAQCGLTTTLIPGERPEVVFTHPIPARFSEVEEITWDYHDDVLRGIHLLPLRRGPGRPRAAGRAAPSSIALADDERATLQRALDSIAQRRASEDADGHHLHGTPGREIIACEGERERRTVVAVLDHMIWFMAQSGSDTFEHHVYLVSLVLVDGVLASEAVERRRKVTVSEHEEPNYDREKARAAVEHELSPS